MIQDIRHLISTSDTPATGRCSRVTTTLGPRNRNLIILFRAGRHRAPAEYHPSALNVQCPLTFNTSNVAAGNMGVGLDFQHGS
jgi:hypothetical protein